MDEFNKGLTDADINFKFPQEESYFGDKTAPEAHQQRPVEAEPEPELTWQESREIRLNNNDSTIAINRDGRIISFDRINRIKGYDLKSGQYFENELDVRNQRPLAAIALRNGNFVVKYGDIGKDRLVYLDPSGKKIGEHFCDNDSFDSRGGLIELADGSVVHLSGRGAEIWDQEKNRITWLENLKEGSHPFPVQFLASAGGNSIFGANEKGFCALWEKKTRVTSIKARFDEHNFIYAVNALPDGRIVIAEWGGFAVRDGKSGKLLGKYNVRGDRSVKIEPIGDDRLAAFGKNGRVDIYDTKNFEIIESVQTDQKLIDGFVGPEGSIIAQGLDSIKVFKKKPVQKVAQNEKTAAIAKEAPALPEFDNAAPEMSDYDGSAPLPVENPVNPDDNMAGAAAAEIPVDSERQEEEEWDPTKAPLLMPRKRGFFDPCDFCNPRELETDSFITRDGKALNIPGHFARPFSEGLAAVKTDRRDWVFVDENGDIVIQNNFDWAGDFKEGVSFVKKDRDSDHLDLIDKKGNLRFSIKGRKASDFSEGTAVVQEDRNIMGFGGMLPPRMMPTEFFYIDKEGKRQFEVNALDARAFHEGLAMVFTPDHRFQYLDKNGQVTLELGDEVKFASDFSEGLAAVECLNKVYYVDKSGNVALEPRERVNWLGDFHEGRAVVVDRFNGHHFFINKAGEQIAGPFDYARDFQGELALVSKKGEYFYIDKDGNRFEPGQTVEDELTDEMFDQGFREKMERDFEKKMKETDPNADLLKKSPQELLMDLADRIEKGL